MHVCQMFVGCESLQPTRGSFGDYEGRGRRRLAPSVILPDGSCSFVFLLLTHQTCQSLTENLIHNVLLCNRGRECVQICTCLRSLRGFFYAPQSCWMCEEDLCKKKERK